MFGRQTYNSGKNKTAPPSVRQNKLSKQRKAQQFPRQGTNVYANYLVPNSGACGGDATPTSSDQFHCEKVMNDSITSLKKILMMHHAGEMSHDMEAVERHVSDRSREVIEEELARIRLRLVNLQGPNPSHAVTAYSQLFKNLLEDTEMVIFNEERRNGDYLRTENLTRKMEADRMQHMLAQELAAREQTVAALNADRMDLEAQIKALLRSNESLKHELGKILQEQTHTHQHAVELRMQGLDYKAEVERRCDQVLRSIQSRLGFVPAGVMKNVQHLRTLKAPGDPAYDTMRRNAYKEAMGPGGRLPARKAAPITSAPSSVAPSSAAPSFSYSNNRDPSPSPEDEDEEPASGSTDEGDNDDDEGHGTLGELGPGTGTDSSPESDGNGGGSSPSLRASGSRVSKWAEMIYEADGMGAGWNQGSVLADKEDDVVDPRVWSTWDEQLNAHIAATGEEQLWGDRNNKGGRRSNKSSAPGSPKSPKRNKEAARPSMGRLRYGSR